jgi:lipopolysaccharide cholinephosphotransferase
LLNIIPHKWTLKRVEKLASKRHDTGLVRLITFPTPHGRAYGFSRRWFEDLADISFEGHMFPGNKDYDGFLSYYYGDYMQLPPPEKRWWHPVSRFKLP